MRFKPVAFSIKNRRKRKPAVKNCVFKLKAVPYTASIGVSDSVPLYTETIETVFVRVCKYDYTRNIKRLITIPSAALSAPRVISLSVCLFK